MLRSFLQETLKLQKIVFFSFLFPSLSVMYLSAHHQVTAEVGPDHASRSKCGFYAQGSRWAWAHQGKCCWAASTLRSPKGHPPPSPKPHSLAGGRGAASQVWGHRPHPHSRQAESTRGPLPHKGHLWKRGGWGLVQSLPAAAVSCRVRTQCSRSPCGGNALLLPTVQGAPGFQMHFRKHLSCILHSGSWAIATATCTFTCSMLSPGSSLPPLDSLNLSPKHSPLLHKIQKKIFLTRVFCNYKHHTTYSFKVFFHFINISP